MGDIISGKIVGAAQITGRVCASSISAGDYTITIDPIECGYRLRVERGGEVQTMELLNGKAGVDGQASYVHIKYSSVPNPASSDEMSDVPQDYIGIYTDNAQEDSSDPADYTWARIKGEPGLKGDPGEPGQDAPQESVLYTPQTLTADQQAQARENIDAASAERVEAVENALPGKLNEPAEGLAVGKYFRVAAIDENGHAVLEAVEAKDVGVQDVQVAGASVVENGVANVPIATNVIPGVSRFSPDMGISQQPNGVAYITMARNANINIRSKYLPVTPAFIDYAVKAAMCDGKGAAWTADEQAAARERMGIPGDYELIASFEMSEDAILSVEIKTDLDGNPFSLRGMIVNAVFMPIETATNFYIFKNNEKGEYEKIYQSSIGWDTDYKTYFTLKVSKHGEQYLKSVTCYKENFYLYDGSSSKISTGLRVCTKSGTTEAASAVLINSIKFESGATCPAGCKFDVYGVRV